MFNMLTRLFPQKQTLKGKLVYEIPQDVLEQLDLRQSDQISINYQDDTVSIKRKYDVASMYLLTKSLKCSTVWCQEGESR